MRLVPTANIAGFPEFGQRKAKKVMSRVRLHGFDAICVSKNSSARNGFVTKDCRQITIRNTGAGIKSDAAAVRRGTRCGAFRRTNRLGGRRGTGAAHRHRTGCRHGRSRETMRALPASGARLRTAGPYAGLCDPPDSLIAPVAFRSVPSAVVCPDSGVFPLACYLRLSRCDAVCDGYLP